MPCDYSKYPKDWKSKIRPDILERAGNKCEQCGVENGKAVFRGTLFGSGRKVFQDVDGNIFDEETGEFLKCDCYEGIEPSTGNPNQMAIKIVLTIAHLDHDIANNEYSNLKALCQLHHLSHDKFHHAQTRRKKKGMNELF